MGVERRRGAGAEERGEGRGAEPWEARAARLQRETEGLRDAGRGAILTVGRARCDKLTG